MKKRITKQQRLTEKQLQALRDYAVLKGQCWRRDLERNWAQGDYPRDVDIDTLQQIRDQFSLEWLSEYRFPAWIDIA
jgi:hypothetical protein